MPSATAPKVRQAHKVVPDYAAVMVDKHCDFCSQGIPVIRFPAAPFSVTVSGGETVAYNEPWDACSRCAPDVRAGKLDTIITRHIAYELQREEVDLLLADRSALNDMRQDARRALLAFQEHWNGEEEAITQAGS